MRWQEGIKLSDLLAYVGKSHYEGSDEDILPYEEDAAEEC